MSYSSSIGCDFISSLAVNAFLHEFLTLSVLKPNKAPDPILDKFLEFFLLPNKLDSFEPPPAPPTVVVPPTPRTLCKLSFKAS